MKKFRCTVTRVDAYEIEFDEEVINKEWLDEIIERFKAYGVSFYNNCGEFDYQNLREQCIEIAVILHKNDESINGIRYQLCDFMSIVQKLVGIRNIGSFMYNG